MDNGKSISRDCVNQLWGEAARDQKGRHGNGDYF